MTLLSRRPPVLLAAALLLSACAGNPPAPAANPPPPPPPAAAPSPAPPPAAATPQAHLSPEQLAAERRTLPKVLAYFGDVVQKNKAAFAKGVGLSTNSYASSRYNEVLVLAITDPAAQKAFLEKITDPEIEALAAASDKDRDYKLGSLIGTHMYRSLIDLPDDQKLEVLRVYSDIFAQASPEECQRLAGGGGEMRAYLQALDRLPRPETDTLMTAFATAARTGNVPPPAPPTAMESELIRLAISQYLGTLPPDQQARLRAAIGNPQSPDKCWTAAQSMKAILAADPETRKLGARVLFLASFGKK